MSNYNYWQDFIEQLEGIKNRETFAGRSTDISQIAYNLAQTVKEYFPINQVPNRIVELLKSNAMQLELAEQHFHLVVEVIIQECQNIQKCEEEKLKNKFAKPEN